VDPRSTARELLARAIVDRVFPAAVAEVGDRSRVLWRCTAGTLTFDAGAHPADEGTIFDLASLTKPIATATLAMRLVASGRLRLGEPLADAFVEWRGEDRDAATVRDLLEHASGLAARFVDQPPEGRREFEHDICRMPLEYAPRTRSLYSDLGFILLGFLVEDRGSAPLADQFSALVEHAIGLGANRPAQDHLRSEVLGFGVPAGLRIRAAPTWPMDEDLRRGRLLAGEVHDNYAAALGSTAGHAGLFGTVGALGALARVMLRGVLGDASVPPPFAPPLVLETIRKSAVPGSSRALGWDTMLPASSCGSRMSPAAFGHVGFSGTSLWIDPILDRYFLLLTNRVCRGGTLDQMRTVRRAFHDVVTEIE
jgi:CubicO group peptidase (beta-lactamase class C family)